MSNDVWKSWNGAAEMPLDLKGSDRVMVRRPHEVVARGPYLASTADWGRVDAYRRVVEHVEIERLTSENAELVAERDATRAGTDSAFNLQHLFLATAEVREARAQREHASVKLERALLIEQIATAISRGHLPSDFHAKLREWCK